MSWWTTMRFEESDYEGEVKKPVSKLTFMKCVPDGKGKLTRKNGDTYDGFWKEGKRYGEATVTKKGAAILKCKYQNNVKIGKGTYTYPNGDTFKAEYVNNEATRGFELTIAELDGAVYSGKVARKDNLMVECPLIPDGERELRFPNGGILKGIFSDGKLNGQTFLTLGSGGSKIYIKGTYKNNKKHGKFYELHFEDGTAVKQQWDEGTQFGHGAKLTQDQAVRKGLFRDEWKDISIDDLESIQSTASRTFHL